MKTKHIIGLTIFTFLNIGPLQAAERDTLQISSIYSNDTINLVSERIIEVDSASAGELIIRFENWAGRTFRDYDKVRTSKTESQITLNYITSSFGLLDMYVSMIVEFKDSKVRVRIFDDGNAFKAGERIGSTTIPSIPSRTYYIKSYFDEGKIIYKPKPGGLNAKQKQAAGAINYKLNIDMTLSKIEESLKNPSKTEPSGSDW